MPTRYYKLENSKCPILNWKGSNVEEVIEKIADLKVEVTDKYEEKFKFMSIEECTKFLTEYNNNRKTTKQIYYPVTKRTVSTKYIDIKKLRDYCNKQIQLEEDKFDVEAERLAEAEEAKRLAIEFAKEMEEKAKKEKLESDYKNIQEILQNGIDIKRDNPSNKFGESRIKRLLENKGVDIETFCRYLYENSENNTVKEFKNKVAFKQIQKICPGLTPPKVAGGSLQDYIQTINDNINTLNANSYDTMESILVQEIPLQNLESICEVGSPMYIFFNFYSKISDNINFFWYVTFKSLLYFTFGDDMDKADCELYIESQKNENRYYNNIQVPQQGRQQLQQTKPQQTRLQQVQQTKPQQTKPQQTKPQQTKPQQVVPQQTTLQQVQQIQQIQQIQQTKPRQNSRNNNTTNIKMPRSSNPGVIPRNSRNARIANYLELPPRYSEP
jgi:hypothetical protein